MASSCCESSRLPCCPTCPPRSGRARPFAPCTRLQLDAVHVGAERDLAQWKCVADPAVRALAGDDLVPNRKSLRVQDVALLSILVLDERDARGTVRIVFDLAHRRRHPVLVALEVDDAIHALVSTANATHGDVPVIVAAAALGERLHQRLLAEVPRDLREIGN